MFARGKSENTVITLEKLASVSSLPNYNTECVFHAVVRLAKITIEVVILEGVGGCVSSVSLLHEVDYGIICST
jgi:hypothetical protein